MYVLNFRVSDIVANILQLWGRKKNSETRVHIESLSSLLLHNVKRSGGLS